MSMSMSVSMLKTQYGPAIAIRAAFIGKLRELIANSVAGAATTVSGSLAEGRGDCILYIYVMLLGGGLSRSGPSERRGLKSLDRCAAMRLWIEASAVPKKRSPVKKK